MADSAVASFQQELAASNTPEALNKIGSYASDFSLIALPGNSDPIYVGGANGTNGVDEDEDLDSTNGYPLPPGAALPFDILNMSAVHLYGTSGDKVAIIRLGR